MNKDLIEHLSYNNLAAMAASSLLSLLFNVTWPWIHVFFKRSTQYDSPLEFTSTSDE
jgi:hypothetical protein